MARPALDALATIEAGGCAIRFRPGTAGAAAAKGYAAACARARKRLAGLGSEPWGNAVQICLVDPFPDPARPGAVMTGGTIVDAERGEIWIVVTAESPPEPPERPLALLFGAALPAAADLGPLLEGYGLHAADSPDPDEHLRGLDLPPLGSPDTGGDLAAAMALSFVRYLLKRGTAADLQGLLNGSRPSRADATAEEVYGTTLAGLEDGWRRSLAGEVPKVKTGQFLRLALRYVRPHLRREAEMGVYMLAGLAFTMIFPFAFRNLIDKAIPSGHLSKVTGLLGLLSVAFVVSLLADLRQRVPCGLRERRGACASCASRCSTSSSNSARDGSAPTSRATSSPACSRMSARSSRVCRAPCATGCSSCCRWWCRASCCSR